MLASVFPPAGSRGDDWHVFPHVTLSRSTLPWERTACESLPAHDRPPWLALLLFDNAEAPEPITVQLSSLNEATAAPAPAWPGLGGPSGPGLEPGQDGQDPVVVIDVPGSLLADLLPADLASLRYSAHARLISPLVSRFSAATTPDTVASLNRGTLSQDLVSLLTQHGLGSASALIEVEERDRRWHLKDPHASDLEIVQVQPGGLEVLGYADPAEVAVVVGSRLPRSGGRSVVHLVSIEGRYAPRGEDDCVFDAGGATDSSPVRLVSLHHWDFACLDAEKSFRRIVGALDAGSIRRPAPSLASHDTEAATTAARLRSGFVPLPHHLRRGDRTLSWYHGPALPDASPMVGAGPAALLPAEHADHLMVFDDEVGMLDVSYAAAWQLGRMTMVSREETALQLFNWKRRQAHGLHEARRAADVGFRFPLPERTGPTAARTAQDLPASVQRLLDDLTVLHHVPFAYLVPDVQMLPRESLRFFAVDPLWIECLRDGALSVGRVGRVELEADRVRHGQWPGPPEMSGLLLRSEAVGSFPGLLVEGYDSVAQGPALQQSPLDGADHPKLRCVRIERLSRDVLLCLFRGRVRMVDLHLSPETLHLGLEPPGDGHAADLHTLTKRLRLDDGAQAAVSTAESPGEARVAVRSTSRRWRP